jgi:hypothetical protein
MLPLLGLLGLGLAAGVKPKYDAWSEGIRGQRADRALEGVGEDPQAQQRALLAGGLLDPATYAGFGADRQRTEMSLGPQWGQLALDRENMQHSWGIQDAGERDRHYKYAFDMAGDISKDQPNFWDFDSAASAIGGLESGGDYGIVNQDSGALGRFQVMPSNIGPWTEKYLGHALTPEEFLASPEAQDKVFEGEFGGLVRQYGFADAASIWHSGRPLAKAIADGANDKNAEGKGMYTSDYVQATSGAYRRALFENSPMGALASQYGPAWSGLKNEEREGVLRGQTAINTMSAVVDYLGGNNAAQRAAQPSKTAAMQTDWQLSVLPFLQDFFQAQSMQEGDLALFQRISGNGFSEGELTGKEQARMRTLIGQAKAYQENKLAALGLNSGGSVETGTGLPEWIQRLNVTRYTGASN